MKAIGRQWSRLEGVRMVLTLKKPKKISLGSVLEKQVRKRPGQAAILFEDRVISYREFNETANRYAHLFQQQGFKKGDVVALLMENRPEYLIAVAGLAKLGIIVSLVNNGVRGKVLSYAINICNAKAAIIGNELLPAFEEVRGDVAFSNPGTVFVEDDGHSIEADKVEDLNSLLRDMPVSNPSSTSGITTDDTLVYIYTSGTTGYPKATASKHHNWFMLGYGSGGLGLMMTPGDVLYNCLPLYHNSGINIAFSSVVVHGSIIALRRKFSARRFWDDVRKYNASHFIYIGELCRYLNNQPPQPDDKDNPLEYILGNGMRGDYWMDFKNRFGIKRIVEVYGATEGVARIINLKQIPGMMGGLNVIGTRIGEVVRYDIENDQIVYDSKGVPVKCQPGETGLLICEINERAKFAGYVNNPEATEAKIMRNVFKKGDQYFNSGDLVKLHPGDYLSFVDRLGDTFRWKGENVSTNEVADILNQFGHIEDSNVYGVQVPGTEGRCGMVALKLQSDYQMDWSGFAQFVIANLPVYARPYFVRLRDEIDATNSFKQIKIRLQQEGFNPEKTTDSLYFLDPRPGDYVPLDNKVYQEILDQQIAF